LGAFEAIAKRMELTINREKTRVTRLTDGFDFIGFQFVKHKSPRSGKNTIYLFPAKSAQQKILKLTVNAAKSAVDRPWRRTFLGFTFTRRRPNRRQVSEKALKALKQEVRQWTGRTRGVPLQRVVQDLRQDLEGWYGSFRFAEGQSIQESSSVGGESCFHPYRRVARHV
jgi:hypothetical protein